MAREELTTRDISTTDRNAGGGIDENVAFLAADGDHTDGQENEQNGISGNS